MLKSSIETRQNGDVVLVDRLSDLPDSVLSHILSFLPIRQVGATSILSKRWKDLWTCVDTLNFCEQRGYNYNANNYSVDEDYDDMDTIPFTEFVYKVLLFHKGSIKNMALTLKFNNVIESDAINWINTAVDRGVECLHLNFKQEEVRLPFCLFNSKTLVDLMLLDVDISNLDTPTAPFFPCLKKLYLIDSWFDPESFEKLISGCSALEHLSVEMDYSVSLTISSSTLKKLELNHYRCRDFYGNKIVLAVPALEMLKMHCLNSEFLIEDQLSSLAVADVCFFSYRFENDDLCRDSFERLLQLASNVKVLRLNCFFTKPMTSPLNAQFHNLTELKVSSPFFEWTLVRSLMERSINLESITLEQTDRERVVDQVSWDDPQDVPHCPLSSLRKIFIAGYGIEDALHMVKYVLEHANVLETMDIHCSGHRDEYKLKLYMLQKIALIKGASRCQISLTTSPSDNLAPRFDIDITG